MIAEDDDARLIAAYLAGDERAFAALYARHAQAVLSYLLGMLADRDVAEDLLQQVFIGLISRLAGLAAGTNVRAFLLASARNSVINRSRDELARRQFAGRYELFVRQRGASESEAGEATERRMRLNRALEALRGDEREVVLLHIQGELTFQQIAEMSQTPLGTVATRYRTALEKMREHLRHE